MLEKTSFKWYLLPFLTVFMLGWIAGSVFSNYSNIGLEKPLSLGVLIGLSPEISSPSDHVPEKDIHVFDENIILDIKDAKWASFTDTNSMDPVIDTGANSIEIRPKSENDIKMGDIISFRTGLAEGIIIHRVVGIGNDDSGRYYVTKGDNNPSVDPGKVRFGDIEGLVVAVVY
ncbi:signal peptidase I [Candidatus Woesearchaeota archaeon CG10_big_fil_rev_8_21_14_0_10_44_13]|nr:MAG: signal peptidase I [Candidatus Woesearchaeota archaeon CG10_big_fil_rev_8_21_14_0_10_44_13]